MKLGLKPCTTNSARPGAAGRSGRAGAAHVYRDHPVARKSCFPGEWVRLGPPRAPPRPALPAIPASRPRDAARDAHACGAVRAVPGPPGMGRAVIREGCSPQETYYCGVRVCGRSHLARRPAPSRGRARRPKRARGARSAGPGLAPRGEGPRAGVCRPYTVGKRCRSAWQHRPRSLRATSVGARAGCARGAGRSHP